MNQSSHLDARILIVDDQEANLRLLERILKQSGYTCFRSLSESRLAVSVCHDFKPDLILLDLMMPDPDGYRVMEQLKELTEGTFLPVLVLTADVTAEAKRKALAAGAKDFLTKPFDAIEVILRIKNLLQTRFLYLQNQQRANERIQEQAALLDHASDAILIQDMEGRIIYWNRGAVQIYGWTVAEAIGRKVTDLLFAGSGAEIGEALEAMQRAGNWEGELRQTTKDGRELVVASRWTLVLDEHGRPKTTIAINSDVTEKKRLEIQLNQAQRLESIGMLAGGIAHDFNNLLTVINGFSDLILTRIRPDDPIRDHTEQIRKAGERATALTRQLLAFSRKQVLALKNLDLNELLTEMEKMLRRLIGEDVDLAVCRHAHLWRVNADPSQMEQVVMNIAINARHAMPYGGNLTIETANVLLDTAYASSHAGAQAGEHVMIGISDTGCGMNQDTKARIFEPFFTTKGPDKGTGLGLSTVYGIVKQSGGSIEVYSEPGVGTSFKIYIPRATIEARVSNGSLASNTQARGSETVLLVEDEDGVRTLAKTILEENGYRVLPARQGREALQLSDRYKEDIHILVTDVVMPNMSGRELAERLLPSRPETKVLYLSGYTDDAIVRHGILDGNVPFLQKPFSPQGLSYKVRCVLDA